MYSIKNITIALILLVISTVSSQEIKVDKVEPPNWWTGMKYNQVQLMLYGSNLNISSAAFDIDKIIIKKIHNLDNDSYVFIDIKIEDDCLPGKYFLTIDSGERKSSIPFSVNEREKTGIRHQGFDSRDIIYLITPDRFVNGDTTNDNITGMRDHADRTDILRRHGGDIQGIIDRLDYIKQLGFTSVWINPLLENDMDISYHGYAATDLYKIDPRFGTNELYKELVEKAHGMGLKIILDHVSNHVGMYHPWVENPPTSNWFNGTLENHIYARHEKSVLLDPYIDSSAYQNIKEGWFVTEMPDLNQSNSFAKNYLIQNTIWWIEYSGLDGIREDTYPYVNQHFLSDWAKAIFREYPDFNIVGEVWINEPAFIAPFQTHSKVALNKNTYLPSVTDFALMESISKVVQGKQSISSIYKCLSKDYLYDDPNMLVTFLDNHDVMRLWDLTNEDIHKYKMALVLLFTLRGIPQIYYGTEIGLPGGDDHGLIRRDMPGGFYNDNVDLFNNKNLSTTQKSIVNFLQKLIAIKNENEVLSSGELVHFAPHEEIYFYYRKNKDEIIIIIVNNSEISKKLLLSDFIEFKNSEIILLDCLKMETMKIKKKQYVKLDKYGSRLLKIIEN